jgi:hypothetical protein
MAEPAVDEQHRFPFAEDGIVHLDSVDRRHAAPGRLGHRRERRHFRPPVGGEGGLQ